ncbi:MAG: Lrp/AsnC family transcriptional regulator, partial [Hyphomicrobiales bacterium]
MDDLDQRLLTLLRADARRTVADLAKRLRVSRATVRSRIDRLCADGIIQGFTVVLKAGTGPNVIRAIMMIEIEGKTSERIIGHLQAMPELRALHTTNGRWDIVAEIEVDTLEAFDRTLRRIREIDGIASTETSLLLSSLKTWVRASGGPSG